MSVVSRKKKIIFHVNLHDHLDDGDGGVCKVCSVENSCLKKMVNRRFKTAIRKFFKCLPFLKSTCQLNSINQIWTTLCISHPNIIQRGKDEFPEWVKWLIVECGMVESFLRTLDFYSELGESQHPEDLEFIKSNQKASVPYYCMFSLSCIPLDEKQFSQIFAKNIDLLFRVIMKYLNVCFTWLETRATCRLLQFIVNYQSRPHLDELIKTFSHPEIFSKVVYYTEHAYDIVYGKLIQHRNERLNYQVRMIFRSTQSENPENHFNDDEETLQPRMWKYAFAWVRWCTSYLKNVQEWDLSDLNGKYRDRILSGLEESKLFRRFTDLMEMQIDDDNDFGLMEMLCSVAIDHRGMKILFKEENLPEKLFEFLCELSLGFMYRKHVCLIFISCLEDIVFFKKVIPFVRSVLPYIFMYNETFEGGDMSRNKYGDKPIGDIVCDVIIQKDRLIFQTGDDENVKILNLAKKVRILNKKRRKSFEMTHTMKKQVLTRHLNNLKSKKDKHGSIYKHENEIEDQFQITEFIFRMVEKYKNENREDRVFHYYNYYLSVSIVAIPDIVWERNVYFNSKFVRLTELTFLQGEMEKNEDRYLEFGAYPLRGCVYEDKSIFESKFVSRAKWEGREGRIYSIYGRPSHPTPTFRKRYNIRTYPDPQKFVGIKDLDKKYSYLVDLITDSINGVLNKIKSGKKKKRKKKKKSARNKKCSQCSARKDSLKRCGRCKRVYYCSRDCQLKHWEQGHSRKCVPV